MIDLNWLTDVPDTGRETTVVTNDFGTTGLTVSGETGVEVVDREGIFARSKNVPGLKRRRSRRKATDGRLTPASAPVSRSNYWSDANSAARNRFPVGSTRPASRPFSSVRRSLLHAERLVLEVFH